MAWKLYMDAEDRLPPKAEETDTGADWEMTIRGDELVIECFSEQGGRTKTIVPFALVDALRESHMSFVKGKRT